MEAPIADKPKITKRTIVRILLRGVGRAWMMMASFLDRG
jgi:hypothetical protein